MVQIVIVAGICFALGGATPALAAPGNGAGISSGVTLIPPAQEETIVEQEAPAPQEQPTPLSCAAGEKLVLNADGTPGCVKQAAPRQPADCAEACASACSNSAKSASGSKSAEKEGKRKGGSNCQSDCVKQKCATPFRCGAFLYLTLGDYIEESIGESFSPASGYFLDESKGALSAVKEKKSEVKAAMQEMHNNPDAQEKYYKQLLIRGCPISSPTEALIVYKKYKKKLNEWRNTLKENNLGVKKRLLVKSGTSAKQAEHGKKPVPVDKEFAESLLYAFEYCALPSSAMDEYFGNVSFKKLVAGDVFPPQREQGVLTYN